MYSGPGDYPDQLWRFAYDDNGYYTIVNCFYTEYTIQLPNDGAVVAGKRSFEDDELWRLVPEAAEHWAE